jgi:hypothetical protein
MRRLVDLEYVSSSRICQDTEQQLRELAALAEPGPSVVRHLVAAYCVQRTVLLLGGHEVDVDDDAITRLGLWTILTLRWSLLAEWIRQHPDDIDGLADGHAPTGVRDEIAAVYELPEAQRLGRLAREYELDGDAVRRYATPIDVLDGAPWPNARSASTSAGSTGARGEAASWRAKSAAASALAPGPESR